MTFHHLAGYEKSCSISFLSNSFRVKFHPNQVIGQINWGVEGLRDTYLDLKHRPNPPNTQLTANSKHLPPESESTLLTSQSTKY